MAKMITLFGKDLKELKFNELKRERRCHSFLLTRIKWLLNQAYADAEKHPESTIQADKIAFFDMYASHLQALIDECDYWLDRRYKPSSKEQSGVTRWLTRKENAERRIPVATPCTPSVPHLADARRIEHLSMVLETIVLPLNYAPIYVGKDSSHPRFQPTSPWLYIKRLRIVGTWYHFHPQSVCFSKVKFEF